MLKTKSFSVPLQFVVRRYYILLLLFLLLVSCNTNTQKPTHNDKNAIEQSIDNWHKAAAQANFNDYFSLMTKDAVFVGTDASEVWNKKEFMTFSKPYFDKGKAWTFTKIERHIYTSDTPYAWFDETLNTWMGVCRGSGVLVKKDGKWLIQHYVLSLTVPNEKVAEVTKLINATNVSAQ